MPNNETLMRQRATKTVAKIAQYGPCAVFLRPSEKLQDSCAIVTLKSERGVEMMIHKLQYLVGVYDHRATADMVEEDLLYPA